MLSVRLGEENKKSFYLEKDVSRLKSDIKFLEKLSQEYTNEASLSDVKNRHQMPSSNKLGDESNQSLVALNKAIIIP